MSLHTPPRDGTDFYRTNCDWDSDRAASIRIVEVVAAATNAELEDLPSLHEHVDTDALDSLFDPRTPDEFAISFQYAGHEVTAHGDGTVTVTARSSTAHSL